MAANPNTGKKSHDTSLEVQSLKNPTKIDDETFNYDIILDHIGQMGKFQKTTCLVLLFTSIFPGFVVMSNSFTNAIPQFR